MFQVVNLVKVRIIIIYISYLSGKLVIENLKYLTIYVQESKKLHPHNHEEIINRTDKEFSSKH